MSVAMRRAAGRRTSTLRSSTSLRWMVTRYGSTCFGLASARARAVDRVWDVEYNAEVMAVRRATKGACGSRVASHPYRLFGNIFPTMAMTLTSWAIAEDCKREHMVAHIVILLARVGLTVAPIIERWVPKSRKWLRTGTSSVRIGHL